MKWLNSLDELLYEVMSWLLFFPVTLWKATLHPFATMLGVEQQADLPDEERYAAILSPPLFLALALLLAHSAATALGQTDGLIANRHGLGSLVTDNATALALRMIVFAGFPLFLAARLVRGRGETLDRRSLRQPFYAQCYPAAVFALGVSLGTSLALVHQPAVRATGQALMAGSTLYLVAVEVRWLATRLGIGHLRAAVSVMAGLLQGSVFMLLVGFLFTR